MRVEPASIDQLLRGRDGRVHHVSADAGGVAEELRRIHPQLILQYNELGEHFAVCFESEDGRDTYLILTAMECDHRITDRIREIDSHGRSGYDYAKELESANQRVRDAALERFRERMGDLGERAAHAIRKDLGSTSRAFIPREVV